MSLGEDREPSAPRQVTPTPPEAKAELCRHANAASRAGDKKIGASWGASDANEDNAEGSTCQRFAGTLCLGQVPPRM